MTTTGTPTLDQILDTYLAAWNAPDTATCLALIGQSFTDDAHYVDPLADVRGHDGIVDMIEALKTQYPGASLSRTSEIDLHHDVARFSWAATSADGEPIVAGIDVAQVGPDGRIANLTGFFG
jgi:hypothetical protein